jgi:hypothetical protein
MSLVPVPLYLCAAPPSLPSLIEHSALSLPDLTGGGTPPSWILWAWAKRTPDARSPTTAPHSPPMSPALRLAAAPAGCAPRWTWPQRLPVAVHLAAPCSYRPTSTTLEICAGLSRPHRFVLRQASYAKWVRCVGSYVGAFFLVGKTL